MFSISFRIRRGEGNPPVQFEDLPLNGRGEGQERRSLRFTRRGRRVKRVTLTFGEIYNNRGTTWLTH